MPPEEEGTEPVEQTPEPQAAPAPAPSDAATPVVEEEDLNEVWNSFDADGTIPAEGKQQDQPAEEEPSEPEPAPESQEEPQPAAAPQGAAPAEAPPGTPAEPAQPAPEQKPQAQPEPEPAAPQQLSPEEERAQIQREENELRRRREAFQEKHGKPYYDPAMLQKQQEIDEIERSFYASSDEGGFPELMKVIDFREERVNNRMNAMQGEIVDAVKEIVGDVRGQVELDLLAVAHPDYPLMAENPEPLFAWVDGLPGSESREAMRVIENGNVFDRQKLISRFKEDKGISDYSELLTAGDGSPPAPANGSGAAKQAPASNAQQPVQNSPAAQPKPQPSPQAAAAEAAAVPEEGTSTPAAPSGARPTSEQDLKAHWDSLPADL